MAEKEKERERTCFLDPHGTQRGGEREMKRKRGQSYICKSTVVPLHMHRGEETRVHPGTEL